jgi:hypothetical protein
MAQVVECLPSVCEVLNSIPSIKEGRKVGRKGKRKGQTDFWAPLQTC